MNHENKDQSGEMRPESEGERQVKVIPISTGVPAEITFIEINGERWVKRKEAIASYRSELKKKIEDSLLQDYLKQELYKIIDQTTEI